MLADGAGEATDHGVRRRSREGDARGPTFALVGGPDRLARVRVQREDGSCGFDQRLAGGSELDLTRGAGEQGRAEVDLQAAHGAAEIGLGEVESLGRPSEVQVLRDGEEHAQLRGIHADPPGN